MASHAQSKQIGIEKPIFSMNSGSSAFPPGPCPVSKSVFPALHRKHLGKIGGQDQWAFLRNVKRKPLTIVTRFKPAGFLKKNRRGIKEIPFSGRKTRFQK
jgi:hypothetical protein